MPKCLLSSNVQNQEESKLELQVPSSDHLEPKSVDTQDLDKDEKFAHSIVLERWLIKVSRK